MLIQLILKEVLLRINAHPFYFLIHVFELKPERKESSIVNFIYNLHILPISPTSLSKKKKFSFAEWPKHDWNILQQDFWD
jgi:hypothetical protein